MMAVVTIRPTARVAAHWAAFYQHPAGSQARLDRQRSPWRTGARQTRGQTADLSQQSRGGSRPDEGASSTSNPTAPRLSDAVWSRAGPQSGPLASRRTIIDSARSDARLMHPEGRIRAVGSIRTGRYTNQPLKTRIGDCSIPACSGADAAHTICGGSGRGHRSGVHTYRIAP
jgi:hypothetical protein